MAGDKDREFPIANENEHGSSFPFWKLLFHQRLSETEKEIQSFEMKIDSCFRKFYQTTTSTISHMLDILNSLLQVQSTPQERHQTTTKDGAQSAPNECVQIPSRDCAKEKELVQINSVHQLQDAIYKLEKYSQERETENLDASTVLVYFKWYLDNLEYIKRLLKIFNDSIFKPLTTDKHTLKSGQVVDLGICQSLAEDEVSKLTKVIDKLKSNINHLLPSRVSRVEPGTCHCETTEHNEQYMNVKLDTFFIDALTKLQAACALAREILQKKRRTTDTDLRAMFIAYAKKKALVDEIDELAKCVAENERNIESLTQDLQMLWIREKRTDDLESNMLETKRTITQLTKTIQTRAIQEKNLKMDLSILDPQSFEYETTLKELNTLSLEKLSIQRQIKTLEYQCNLFRQDLEIEYDLKPDIVRFSDDVQSKIETFENSIQKASRKKFKLEALLRADCEGIK